MDYSALENQALAQGKAAQAQGQSMLASDQSNATNYQNQYNQASQQAAGENQNLQNYTQAEQGAYNPNTGTGNAGSMLQYYTGLGNQEAGYNPQAMQAATQNLTQEQNQLANVANASQSSTGGYGLSGAQLAGFYGSLSAPLQQQAAAQNNVVGNMLGQLNAATQYAQSGTAGGIQAEQNTAGQLNQVYQNTLAQAAQYQQQMQAFQTLAQQQGGLNAEQQATYDSIAQGYASTAANAAQAYAAANQSNAQAALYNQEYNAATNKDSTPTTTTKTSSTNVTLKPNATPKASNSVLPTKQVGKATEYTSPTNSAQLRQEFLQPYGV